MPDIKDISRHLFPTKLSNEWMLKLSLVQFQQRTRTVWRMLNFCIYNAKTSVNWLIVWILWHINLGRLFNTTSIFIQILFFKQLGLAWAHSLIVKNILFQAIQFSQTVLIQTIQFNMSSVSVSKTVLFRAIQFCISIQFICQNSSISSNSF